MRSLAALDRLHSLSGGLSWDCKHCGDPQIALPGAKPPEDRLCWQCQDDPWAVAGALSRHWLEGRLRAAGVPPMYRRNVGREEWSRHFRRAWPAELSKWPAAAFETNIGIAYLWGKTGTGKTSAAAVLLAEHLALGGRAVWTSGLSLTRDLRAEISANSAPRALQRLLLAPFAVVDEPLAGELKAWALTQLYDVVNHRLEEDLPTVYTSQLGPHELMGEGDRPGAAPPALASRLLSGERVHLGGEDVRLRDEEES